MKGSIEVLLLQSDDVTTHCDDFSTCGDVVSTRHGDISNLQNVSIHHVVLSVVMTSALTNYVLYIAVHLAMTCPYTKYPDTDCFLLAGANEVIVCPRKKAVRVRARDGVRPYVFVSAEQGGDAATCCQCHLFDH